MAEFTAPFNTLSATNSSPLRLNHDPSATEYIALAEDADGSVYFLARVPADYSSLTNAKFQFVAEATTGVSRVNIEATGIDEDSGSMDPASFTAMEVQDITVDATQVDTNLVTCDASLPTLTAGGLVAGRVFHEGSHVNDTLSVPTLVLPIGVTFTYST